MKIKKIHFSLSALLMLNIEIAYATKETKNRSSNRESLLKLKKKLSDSGLTNETNSHYIKKTLPSLDKKRNLNLPEINNKNDKQNVYIKKNKGENKITLLWDAINHFKKNKSLLIAKKDFKYKEIQEIQDLYDEKTNTYNEKEEQLLYIEEKISVKESEIKYLKSLFSQHINEKSDKSDKIVKLAHEDIMLNEEKQLKAKNLHDLKLKEYENLKDKMYKIRMSKSYARQEIQDLKKLYEQKMEEYEDIKTQIYEININIKKNEQTIKQLLIESN